MEGVGRRGGPAATRPGRAGWPPGPHRARRGYSQLHALASRPRPPRRRSGTQGRVCRGCPTREGQRGPRVPHSAPRSWVPPARPPEMQWDKAAQTEGRRALLPPWLPSLGELQAPTGLGTGSGGGGKDCLCPTQPDPAARQERPQQPSPPPRGGRPRVLRLPTGVRAAVRTGSPERSPTAPVQV